MKSVKKIISFLMVTALVLSSFPLSIISGNALPASVAADASLVLNRPNASVVVTEVTRVAYGVNSMKQPSGSNSVIVKATPSGIPYTTGKYASLGYAGETPAYTMVSFTPGMELESSPTITCSNTTVTMSDYTYSNGTYVWQVTGGTATVGTTLIFTVSYSFSEINGVTGKTYTHAFHTYGTSYVEAIATPAGIYSSKRTYEDYGFGTSTKNRSYLASYILGVNTYGSVYSNGTGDGSVDFTGTASWSSSIGWTTDYGMMKTAGESDASRQYNLAYTADGFRPLTYVYLDKSINSTLSDLNLRLQTASIAQSDESDEIVTVSVSGIFSESGIVNTFGGKSETADPSNDASVASQLGLTAYTGSTKGAGTNFLMYFSGVGPTSTNTTTDYTVSVKYNTSAQWSGVYVGHSFSLEVLTYDKGALRTLIEEIQGTDPTIMTTDLPKGEFKGYNPQSWYYASGWETFLNAFNAAKACLSKPNVTQAQIDSSYTKLAEAYDGLTLQTADYSLATAYYNQALKKVESNYTLASWAKLKTAINNYQSNYNILYQPAVDKMATDIKTAMDNLVETNADYSDFLANLSTVNKLMSNSLIIYGIPASQVYTNWSSLTSVLKNSGCVYNTTDGYVVEQYLPKSQQSTVDGYVMLITKAINALTLKSANYTAATKAESAYKLVNISYITDEIAASLTAAYNSLAALHGLNISRQSDVDAAVAELNYWLDNLEYKPASTTAAENLIAYANSLDRSMYGDFTAVDTAVANLRSKLGLDIRYQTEIDRYTAALQSAIDSLTANTANYSAVDTAIASADAVAKEISERYADTYGFTADIFYSNWASVQTAINNVVRGLDLTKQSQVNGYATAINAAIGSLTEAKADYSEVTALQTRAYDIVTNSTDLYTSSSLDALTTAYISVVTNLKISKQSTVDSYAQAIQQAINNLVYLDANYSQVNAQLTAARAKLAQDDAYSAQHPGYSYYTAESTAALDVAIASVETGLDIRSQSTVDGYANAIQTAIEGLVLSGADYTHVDVAISQIPADTSLYTSLSVAMLNATVNSINRTFTADKQSTVDKYVTSINNAVANLKYKSADYSAVTAAKAKVPSDPSIYTEESWQYLQDKINAVVYNLDINYQDEVDTYALAIETAISILKYVGADYTAVDIVLGNVPDDLTIYTDETVSVLNTAIAAVVRNLDITEQATVDGYAAAINAALGNLAIKAADCSAVKEEIRKAEEKIATGYYTDDSVSALRTVISQVRSVISGPIDIRDQATVDALVVTVRNAADALIYKDADYTAVTQAVTEANLKIDTGWYTDDSVANLQAKLDAVVTGYNASRQAEVNKFAEDIVKATKELNLKLANYTELQKILNLLDNSSSEIYTNTYSNFDEVMALITSYRTNTVDLNMSLTIDKQADVDNMTSTLQSYIDSLILAQAIFKAKEGSTTIIGTKSGVQYIYGLRTNLTKSTFLRSCVTSENVTVEITVVNNSLYMGTGTTVKVTSDLTGEVIGTYVILIYGDVTGDGQISSTDLMTMNLSLRGDSDPLAGAERQAANINGDRLFNTADSSTLVEVMAGNMIIDQTTGKAFI